MNNLKAAALAALILGALASGIGGLALAGLREPAGDQEDPSRSRASRPADGEEVPRNRGYAATPGTITDLRGQWEVLYVAGAVAGQQRGLCDA